MPDEQKPIVLRDELATMARAANPAAWLEDATPAVKEWVKVMRGAKGKGLDANYRPAHKAMDIEKHGFGDDQEVFCCYIASRDLQFKTPDGRRQTIETEQEFLKHLLGVLKDALKE